MREKESKLLQEKKVLTCPNAMILSYTTTLALYLPVHKI